MSAEATPQPRKRRLVVTIGLPRSGKTTFARSCRDAAIVNPDSIRLAVHGMRFAAPAEPFVWAIARVMVEALFRAGHDHVIVDATNVTQKRRDVWAEIARALDVEYETALIGTGPAECIRRAESEGDAEIVPVIRRMAAEWDLERPPGWML